MKKLLLRALFLLLLLTVAFIALFYQRDLTHEELAPRYTDATSAFLELPAATVHYRDEGTGPPLLLLHGFAASLHAWDGWTAQLAGSFRVLRLDLPGFGLTGPFHDRRYATERYLELLDAFLDALGVERCSIAGNSMGGNIAWRYALERPERVEKLVLIDAGGALPRSGGGVLDITRMPVIKQLSTKVTPRFLFEHATRDAYGDDSLVTPELVDRYYQLALLAGNRQALVDRMAAMGPARPEAIRGVRQPTLVMWGAEDTWITAQAAHRFHRELPRSELLIYDGVGHLPMEEVPERSAADARAFLLGGEPAP